MVYEMTLSNNAEAIRQENEKIELAKVEEKMEGKIEIIVALAETGMPLEQIALISQMSLEEVKNKIEIHKNS